MTPTVGVVGVVATFAIAGPVAGIAGFVILLLLVIAALFNSLRSSIQDPSAPEREEDASEEKVEQSNPPSDAGQEPELEPPTEPAKSDEESNDPFMLAFRALVGGDIASAESYFAEYEDAGESQEERIERKAQSLGWLASRGKPSALSELADLRSNNPGLERPLHALAMAHSDLGDPRTAAELIDSHIAGVDAQAQFSLIVAQAEYWSDAGEPDAALSVSLQALGHAQTQDQIARAQEARGKALEDLGRHFEAFGAREEALLADPSRKSLRFALAYAYSKQDLDTLAVFHYQVLLQQQPNNCGARNNLGVELVTLDVKSAAVEEFKKAADDNEQYAPANLAGRLVSAGFLDEAASWIRQAQEHENPPPFVGTTSASIGDAREKDVEKRREITTEGDGLRAQMRAFAAGTECTSPVGEWLIDGEQPLIFETSDETTYVAESGKGSDKLEIVLARHGNGYKVKWKEGSYASSSDGFAVISGTELRGILLNKPTRNRATSFTARRA